MGGCVEAYRRCRVCQAGEALQPIEQLCGQRTAIAKADHVGLAHQKEQVHVTIHGLRRAGASGGAWLHRFGCRLWDTVQLVLLEKRS